MKRALVLSFAFALASFAAPAFADGQFLGNFELKISPAPWEPAMNPMSIGAPTAEVAYADFSYAPAEALTLKFNPGSGSSSACDREKLGYKFEVFAKDASGELVRQSEFTLGGSAQFAAGGSYVVRYSISGLVSTACEWINVSFITFKLN